MKLLEHVYKGLGVKFNFLLIPKLVLGGTLMSDSDMHHMPVNTLPS